MRYVGYAVSEELNAVWLLQSDLANRQTVANNAQRCISDAMGYDIGVCDIELHTARAGEDITEYAELLARDMVSGCDGVDQGYTFFDEPITIDKRERSAYALCDDLAAYHRCNKRNMRKFFDTWQTVFMEMDESRAFRDFESFIDKMQANY